MKNLSLIVFSLLLNQGLTAQIHIETISISKDKDTIIGFVINSDSRKMMTNLAHLIEEKNYDEVKKLLLSKNKAKKFLAAVECNKLQSQRKMTLTYDEKMEIKKIYSLNEIDYACFGCRHTSEKSIKIYVFSKDKKKLRGKIDIWLNKNLV
ncbi:hypothetical protein [Flavobacterium sp. N1994]|uniref:hypothetical protein n=1 Tax=Flavobacterium sp. N1994 TaxID=2986827 RepID=UPI002222ACE1|nr:hypothetical protein [Flavobacterium sp. N1994]